MKYDHALNIANEFIKIIEPYTDEIVIAGSLRRKCDNITDIDLVVKQKSYHLQKFLMDHAKDHQISTKANDPLLKLKHGQRQMQILFQGVKFELYFPKPDNWGLILFIRTGSAKFVRNTFAMWNRQGGYCDEGVLRRSNHKAVPIPDEKTFFETIGIDPVAPEDRTI